MDIGLFRKDVADRAGTAACNHESGGTALSSRRFPLFKALAAAVLLAASVAAAPARADIIHNGHADFGGPGFIAGTGGVDVALFDVSGIDGIGSECSDLGAAFCLGKVYLPGSESQQHEMGFLPPAEDFVFAEFVINDTGVPWTDYHVSVSNAEFAIGSAAVGTFVEDEFVDLEGLLDGFLEPTDAGFDLWLFFDGPFPSGEEVFLALFLALDVIEEAPVFITQHPSLGIPEPATLSIFGAGLLALGLARRRRKRA